MSVLGHLAFGVRQYMRQYMSVLGHLAFGALGDESRRCDNGQSLVLEVRAELHSQGHHLTSFAASGKSLQASEHPLLILHVGLEKSTALDFPRGSVDKNPPTQLNGKESAATAGNPRLIPESGRSPGGGNGNPL